MDTIAIYTGYIVIGLIALVLIGALLLALVGTVMGLYRIIKYRQTSRFIKKYETKAMYKACKVAVNLLISKGVSWDNTLEEALIKIERYGERFKVKED